MDASSSSPSLASSPTGPDFARWQRRWRLLALFLIVVGARLWLVNRYALALPMWDQWDGEGLAVLKPWVEGTFDWRVLLLPHNEHRIVLTRLLGLGLFAANGQWDNQVQMAFNAVFWGLSALGVAGVALRAFQGRFQRTICLAVGLYFVLPFGWENTLFGFESQNYFLIIFSLGAAWGLGLQRVFSARWFLGLAGLILACLSMATGFLAAAAVLGLFVLRGWRERRWPSPGEWFTGLLCAGVVALGLATRVVVPANRALQTGSLGALLAAWGRLLAWPWCEYPVLGPLALLPLLGLVVVYWRRGVVDPRRLELLLVGGLWVLLQTGAMAYGRGGPAAPPPSRYMDLLAVLPLANFLGCLALVLHVRGTRWLVPTAAGAALWTLPLLGGLWTETARDLRFWMPTYLRQQRAGAGSVRGYVATRDFARFLAAREPHDLPFPEPARLATFLDDGTLRRILPADLRPPIPWQEAPADGRAAFVPGGYDPACGVPPEGVNRGSFTRQGGAQTGTWHARLAELVTLPYLRVNFAGYPGEPGLDFALRDPASNRQTVWQPGSAPGEHWHQDDLPAPGRHLELTATDESATRWFAFGEPVEVGGWSHWTGFLLRRGGKLFWAGVLLLAGLEGLWRLARPKTAR